MPLSDGDIDAAVEVAIHASYCGTTVINAALEDPRAASDRCASSEWLLSLERRCTDEMIHFLRARTPTFSVLTKVDGLQYKMNSSVPTWVVDSSGPSSTSAFAFSHSCVCIALLVDNEVVLGVVSAPRLCEFYTAVKGRGSFCNGQRIQVSNTPTLQEAVVLCPQECKRSERAVRNMMAIHMELNTIPVQAVSGHGGAALDMCFVAAGKADAYFDAGIPFWIAAAGALIIREAGGVVYDVEKPDGQIEWVCRPLSILACGNHVALASSLVALLKKNQYCQAMLV